ncbi:MAG: SPOR domain-containing protein [Campylobacterales bacterium]|nr:SPOR domain-containing protein [Campylobacterales bacterium]
MNPHNLDDLIIDNIEPKNSKIKGLLTIIALIIVILIVAIILTRIILKDPNAERIALEENHTELISPELTLQQAAQEPKEIKEETMLSSTVKEEPVKEDLSIANNDVSAPKEITSQPIVENKPIDEELENNAEDTTVIPEAESMPKPETSKETPKIEETPLPRTVNEPKKIVKETSAKKPEPKPLPVAKPQPTVPQGGEYYIQVGSFRSMPSSQFLNVIKNNGFQYQIVTDAHSGTNKLLIGPYSNRAAADRAVPSVKDRINKGAFVIQK